MKYTVRFEAPRIYNLGHLRGERRAWGVHVHAADAVAAEAHALRVTQGRARIMETVEGFQPVEPPQ